MARPADRMTNQSDSIDLDDRTSRRRSDVATDGNGAAIAALVVGLLAATFAILIITVPAGIVFGIVAVILGAMGISKAGKLGGLHKGLAVTGLISGLLGLIIAGLTIWAGVTIFQQGQQELQTNTELQQQLEELQQQVEDTTQG